MWCQSRETQLGLGPISIENLTIIEIHSKIITIIMIVEKEIEEVPSGVFGCGGRIGGGIVGLRSRRGILSFGFGLVAFEIGPIGAANGEGGECGEGKPEAASAESRRSRPEEAELATEAEEEESRPPRPPRPPDHQADHHGKPNRDRA